MRVRSLIGGHGVKPRCFLFNEGFSLLQTGSVPHTGPIVEARRRSGSNGVALRCAYLDTSEPRGGAWASPRYDVEWGASTLDAGCAGTTYGTCAEGTGAMAPSGRCGVARQPGHHASH